MKEGKLEDLEQERHRDYGRDCSRILTRGPRRLTRRREHHSPPSESLAVVSTA
ncbi:uncharacterized protein G2W53_007970 [Senna tora]|uniref:Uncharacterized protein n=1 Tax=Senna tora TaxID=362788 RepID=A0A834X970_9FABA|nr:uncharacterized protein G2W53_007970 [Senna tora]